MNITTLRYFIAVAENNSFSKASEELFVAQPTLSRHIANLEASLGYQLFQRSTHSVKLTAEGAACLEHARTILQELEAMKKIAIKAENPEGHVSIGYVETVETTLIQRMHQLLSSCFPAIKVQLYPDKPANLKRSVEDGRLDFVCLPLPIATSIRNAERRTLVRQGAKVMVSEKSPLASKDKIYFSDLKGLTLVIFQKESASEIYQTIIHKLQKEDVLPSTILTASSVEQNVMLVSADINRFSIHASLGVLQYYEGLRFRQIEGWTDGFDVNLCWKKENPNPLIHVVEKCFRNFLTV